MGGQRIDNRLSYLNRFFTLLSSNLTRFIVKDRGDPILLLVQNRIGFRDFDFRLGKNPVEKLFPNDGLLLGGGVEQIVPSILDPAWDFDERDFALSQINTGKTFGAKNLKRALGLVTTP